MTDDDHEFARQLFADDASPEAEPEELDPHHGAHVPSEGTGTGRISLGAHDHSETLRSIFNGNPF